VRASSRSPGCGGDSGFASRDPASVFLLSGEFPYIFLMRAAASGDTSATGRWDMENEELTRLQLRAFLSDTAIIYNSGTYRMLWKKTSS